MFRTSQLELFDQDTSVEVVAGKDTFEEVTKYKMKSQSLVKILIEQLYQATIARCREWMYL